MAYRGSLLDLEAIVRITRLGEIEEALIDYTGGLTPTPNRANMRRPQRYSLCKTPRHKRNRYKRGLNSFIFNNFAL